MNYSHYGAVIRLLLPLIYTAEEPTSSFVNKHLLIDQELFVDASVIHEADYDIIKIVVPHNNLYQDDANYEYSSGLYERNYTLFFLEADLKENTIEYKGLSILKDGKVKKLLENGRDAVSGDPGTNDMFFAATDGLYYYDHEKNEALVYGDVSLNLIAITKVPGEDIFYVLTDKNHLIRVTDEGTGLYLLDVEGATQIACLPDGTLLYVDNKNDVYMMKDTTISKINGLPISKNSVNLLRPILLNEIHLQYNPNKRYVAIAIVDGTPYIILPTGVATSAGIMLNAKPTAYAMDALYVQLYAFNKKIFRYESYYKDVEIESTAS